MYFLLLESVVCALRGWYLKKKATTPPTQTHPEGGPQFLSGVHVKKKK